MRLHRRRANNETSQKVDFDDLVIIAFTGF